MQLFSDEHIYRSKTPCLTSILRRQRWLNTDSLRISSAFSDQVYEPYYKTKCPAAEYNLPFVDNLISFVATDDVNSRRLVAPFEYATITSELYYYRE